MVAVTSVDRAISIFSKGNALVLLRTTCEGAALLEDNSHRCVADAVSATYANIHRPRPVDRSDLLREFADRKRALMTNARCLTEGVDVPTIDCVTFADPKQARLISSKPRDAHCGCIRGKNTAISSFQLSCLRA